MNYTDIIHIASAFLQLVVAWYAFQLGRVMGMRRTGGLLFSGLSLLAIIHLAVSFGPLYDRSDWEVKIEYIYALFSVLLFLGMARLRSLFDSTIRKKDAKLQKNSELEAKKSELENQIAALIRANEDWPKAYSDLQQTAARLQNELNEQKTLNNGLTSANAQLSEAAERLRQENTALAQQLAEEKRGREQVENAYAEALEAPPEPEPEKPDVDIAAILHLNHILDNVNVSVGFLADHLTQSRTAHLMRLARLMRDHSRNLANFVTRDPRGRQLPDSLTLLAQQWSDEQVLLVKKVDSLKRKIERMKGIEITRLEQGPPPQAVSFRNGDSGEPAVPFAGGFTLQAGQTETVTTAPVLIPEETSADIEAGQETGGPIIEGTHVIG
jgi:hypothetical protein